jgi:hypothetical protein
MTTKVLLTHHHRDAIENAADRGFWMPLPIEAEQLKDVMYLTSLSYGEITLKQLVEVASFEPWRESDGIERWLPFLGQRLELPKPLPLGDRQLLAGWLHVSARRCRSWSSMHCWRLNVSAMCCPAPVPVATCRGALLLPRPLMQPAGEIWLLEHPVLEAPHQESALVAGSCFAVQGTEPAPHRVGAHLQL